MVVHLTLWSLILNDVGIADVKGERWTGLVGEEEFVASHGETKDGTYNILDHA